ncbi:LysR substrate-binding domain-containing protein [Tritonibacter scottomollicae]|uniref:DNA-binding transcriptional LysR family regulator n=1 Tax=Tritonibacter scottomollicae TaxID=483013 RepID=A0A2T1ANS7_TRISK|nr:LysR substrate-binding domain-containing protein [Tritonibacter scottomollicae]PRZ50222.1 DNA-binding transcriptional LysR family regulator [Tritonibacter scottomollicae]
MHNLNSIPLSALRTIEAIARHGTLRAAAEELGVTSGALSQRLGKAEEILGQVLFHRTSKGLHPTEICTRIAPRLSAAMAELSAVLSEVRNRQGDALTLTVAPIFASRWLIWRLRRFNDTNPHIRLSVIPTADVIDLNTSDVDIGIRVSESGPLGAEATPLLVQRVFPVCAPEIAAQIRAPEDLFRFPVIREDARLYGWASWLAHIGLAEQEIPAGPTFADSSLCLDAAMTGQGVFMAWETLACDALERGQVAAPLAHRADTKATYWFAVAPHAARNPAVKVFRVWLEAELACSMAFWGKS